MEKSRKSLLQTSILRLFMSSLDGVRLDQLILCKNDLHLNTILLFVFKLSLPTSFLSSNIKRIFYLE